MNITRNKKQKIGKNKRNTIKRSSKKNITSKRRKKNNKTNKKRLVTRGGSNWNPIIIYKKGQALYRNRKAIEAKKTAKNKLENVTNNAENILVKYEKTSNRGTENQKKVYAGATRLDNAIRDAKSSSLFNYNVYEFSPITIAEKLSSKMYNIVHSDEENDKNKKLNKKLDINHPIASIIGIILAVYIERDVLDLFKKEGEFSEQITKRILDFINPLTLYSEPDPKKQNQMVRKIQFTGKMYKNLEDAVGTDGVITKFFTKINFFTPEYKDLDKYIVTPYRKKEEYNIDDIQKMREQMVRHNSKIIFYSLTKAINTLHGSLSSENKEAILNDADKKEETQNFVLKRNAFKNTFDKMRENAREHHTQYKDIWLPVRDW